MIYFFRNNQTDFNKWCRDIVPQALCALELNEDNNVWLTFNEEDYREMLRIKRQLVVLKASLDKRHLDYFEGVLLQKKRIGNSNVEIALYRDIFHNWQMICFPNGKSRIVAMDAVMLGGELRRQRVLKGMYVQQVADIAGISSKALYAYEEGTREMKASTFCKLCQVYRVKMDEIKDRCTA